MKSDNRYQEAISLLTALHVNYTEASAETRWEQQHVIMNMVADFLQDKPEIHPSSNFVRYDGGRLVMCIDTGEIGKVYKNSEGDLIYKFENSIKFISKKI